MKGDYPDFKALYAHEELAEHFLLSPHERLLISQLRGDLNRHGAAVLLKSLSYLGYFPDNLDGVPPEIKEFIAKQFNLLWDISTDYPTGERTRCYHLALIHKSLRWRFPTVPPPSAPGDRC